jgi:hypothetical protein
LEIILLLVEIEGPGVATVTLYSKH